MIDDTVVINWDMIAYYGGMVAIVIGVLVYVLTKSNRGE